MKQVFSEHLFMGCLSRIRTVLVWRRTEVLESSTYVLGATGTRLIQEPLEAPTHILNPSTLTIDTSRSFGRRITAGTRDTMMEERYVWN